DARGEALDLAGVRERPELQVVAARLPRPQLDQLAASTRVEPAGDAVRARLDSDDVGALAEHPPDEVVRHLVPPEALVEPDLELVADREARLADPRLDPPPQHELLAEDGRLAHLALRPQHALVAVPALAVAGEPRGAARDAPVEPVRLGRPGGIVVLLGRVL